MLYLYTTTSCTAAATFFYNAAIFRSSISDTDADTDVGDTENFLTALNVFSIASMFALLFVMHKLVKQAHQNNGGRQEVPPQRIQIAVGLLSGLFAGGLYSLPGWYSFELINDRDIRNACYVEMAPALFSILLSSLIFLFNRYCNCLRDDANDEDNQHLPLLEG